MHDVFQKIVDDLFIESGIGLVRLGVDDMGALLKNAAQFGLDFDDAYQLTAARKHGFTLVSFDTDFDRTPGGRMDLSELH